MWSMCSGFVGRWAVCRWISAPVTEIYYSMTVYVHATSSGLLIGIIRLYDESLSLISPTLAGLLSLVQTTLQIMPRVIEVLISLRPRSLRHLQISWVSLQKYNRLSLNDNFYTTEPTTHLSNIVSNMPTCILRVKTVLP